MGIFGSDSDSDDVDNEDAYRRRLQRRATKKVCVDDSLGYDDVYDDIDRDRKRLKTDSAKVIQGMKKAKKQREIESIKRDEDRVKIHNAQAISEGRQVFTTEGYAEYKRGLEESVPSHSSRPRTAPKRADPKPLESELTPQDYLDLFATKITSKQLAEYRQRYHERHWH